MRIGITVYIDSFENLYTEGGNRQYWDTFGGSQAIDDDLKEFQKTNLALPTVKPSNGYIVTGITSTGYNWRVIVASFAEREALKITKFPTIIFTDTEGGKEKGRIEGTPYPTGIVKELLQKIFAGATNTGILNTNKKKAASFAALFLLLLFKLKKGAAVAKG
jgi:hypothetical protein